MKKILWIVMAALMAGGLFFYYAFRNHPIYTAKATVFPLTNNVESSLSSSALSGILGLGDAQKSFSSEATINIIDLTLSRNTREAVASSRLPAFGNKPIACLLIEDYNAHKWWWAKTMLLPADSMDLAMQGAEMIRLDLFAKMSKNGLLEIYFSHPNKELVTPISNVLIEKVSQFYIDLKIRKATADYNFTVKKIAVFDSIINGIDSRAIRLQNTTLFTPDKLEYEIPKEKVLAERQRYTRQRDISYNNQEEALWKLQKQTPIVSVLDRPTEPFTIKKKSVLLYAILGVMFGTLFASFLSVWGLLWDYTRAEIRKALFGISE